MKKNNQLFFLFFWSIVVVMALILLAKGIHGDRFDLLRDPYHAPQIMLPIFHHYLVVGVIAGIVAGSIFIFAPRRKMSPTIVTILLQDVLIVISLCVAILWTWRVFSPDGGLFTMTNTFLYGVFALIFAITISLHKMTERAYSLADNKRYILSVLIAGYGVVLLLARMKLSWRPEFFIATIAFITIWGISVLLLKGRE